MTWKTYTPKSKESIMYPQIRIYKSGRITLTKPAYKMIGSPSRVNLLYNTETKEIAIQPSESGSHNVKLYKNDPSVYIHGLSFLNSFDIRIDKVRYFDAVKEDDFIKTNIGVM